MAAGQLVTLMSAAQNLPHMSSDATPTCEHYTQDAGPHVTTISLTLDPDPDPNPTPDPDSRKAHLARSLRASPGPPAGVLSAVSVTATRSIAASRGRPPLPANAAGSALLQARAAAASQAFSSARAACASTRCYVRVRESGSNISDQG